jgi:hypothetical protein
MYRHAFTPDMRLSGGIFSMWAALVTIAGNFDVEVEAIEEAEEVVVESIIDDAISMYDTPPPVTLALLSTWALCSCCADSSLYRIISSIIVTSIPDSKPQMRLISESLGREKAIVFKMAIAIGVYFPGDAADDAAEDDDVTSDFFSFAASTLGGQPIRILAYASMTRKTVLASEQADELTATRNDDDKGTGKPTAVFRCTTREAFSGEDGFRTLLSSSTTIILDDDGDGGAGGGTAPEEDEAAVAAGC